MRVLIVNRSDAYTRFGGDTVQMEETKNALLKLGVDVTVKLGEQEIEEYKNFDLVHIFNIQTDRFSLNEIKKVKESGASIIVSPIWWDNEIYEVSDFSRFSKNARILSKLIGKENMIKIKRHRLNSRYQRMKEILNISDKVLPNSHMEEELIKKYFNVPDKKISVVYNAISSEYMIEDGDNSGEFALQVGRIEEAKKTYQTIKACNELNINLKIVGKDINEEYYAKCLDEGRKGNVQFLGMKNKDELIEIYKKAKVHILPSDRETPGLVSLEAASLGCVIVSTEVGSAKEYFGELATYCNPNDYDSIKDAINIAWKKNKDSKLREKIINNFTWQRAAEDTLENYKLVLNNK